RFPDGFAAHIHGDKAGREERSVLIPVDLLKNKPEHRGINQRFVILLNGFGTFTAKIVGIEERKQIFQGGEFTRNAPSVLIFQHRLRQNGKHFVILQIADKDGIVLHFRRFKKRRVEVGDKRKILLHLRNPLIIFLGEHLKKQTVQIIKIRNLLDVQKVVIRIALVVGKQLRLK